MTEILDSLQNDFEDNHDYYRFGPAPKPRFRERAKKLVARFTGPLINPSHMVENFHSLDQYYKGFGALYDRLEDEKSKRLLVKLVAYRVLGPHRVKLPRNNETYWKNLETISALEDDSDCIDIDFLGWKLKRTRLSSLNIPVDLYYMNVGTNCTFLLEQYKYVDSEGRPIVQAEPGDTVLDLGGCWGDTAIYFADRVGDEGRVYSFEFIPSNVSIFERNVALNPALEGTIQLVERPVWNESDLELYYDDNGPASKVSFDQDASYSGKARTISVDDLVRENKVDKVDFIKMDIEGAELNALRGAEDTLNRFRPKLAISLYHSLDDFTQIPAYIASLDLGYRFYLDHFTIHTDETILFAISSAK